MSEPPGQLAAVVLNYCTYASTLTCLEHLLRSPDIGRVYVVDNASPDGSGARLQRHFAHGAFTLTLTPTAGSQGDRGLHASGVEVVLIRSEDNRGYGPGNNLALRRALDEGHRAALVVNPDVVVEPASVAAMLSRLTRPLAVVGTVLWQDPARTRLECFGASSYARFTSRSQPARSAEQASDADYFSGACYVADLAALAAVGWLAEDYFLYCEELDLVKRLARVGLAWGVAGDAWAVHHKGESIGSSADLSTKSLLSSYYGTRSAVAYTRKWEPWCLPTVVVVRTLRALGITLRAPSQGWAILSAIASALRPHPRAPGLVRPARGDGEITSETTSTPSAGQRGGRR